jgi:2-phospho-L-lactate/phosphoenolpyruvate guanylyltransferase
MAAGVLIPVKAFRDAKVRLAPALAPAERAALARSMATGVVAAAGALPVWVVCDDPEVAQWAGSVGANVLWMPERGLNRAVTEGVASLAAAGVQRAVVCHADLPHATTLTHVSGSVDAGPDVVLVPDRQRKGTNVVSLPTASGFRFAYGPGSFDRHLAEARRLSLTVDIVHDPSLAWDVDVPDDLPDALAAAPAVAVADSIPDSRHHGVAR